MLSRIVALRDRVELLAPSAVAAAVGAVVEGSVVAVVGVVAVDDADGAVDAGAVVDRVVVVAVRKGEVGSKGDGAGEARLFCLTGGSLGSSRQRDHGLTPG